ncbi:MAG TPA: histidinol-phosphatase [Verrucomicrobiae bacterium]|jgi:hypothetical protein
MPFFVALALICLASYANAAPAASSAMLRWWKGNLHTHTLWSDGDDYPEMVVNWYKENGYNFLALSDHNILLQGSKWVAITNTPRGQLAFARYLDTFGESWIRQKSMHGTQYVRLKTLPEFRPWFEEPDRFLLISSQELSDEYGKIPIHLNFSNVKDYIPPQGGSNVLDVIQRNIDALLAQQKKRRQPMLVHVNHPNFGWAIPAEALMRVQGDRFFEVYNGHAMVRNAGDSLHASVERIWDIILTFRLSELGLPPMFGLAVDDSHNYFHLGPTNNNSGRGWIVIRAERLAPGALFAAMERGDFYASTGVRLADIVRAEDHISLKIEPDDKAAFVTQFIGTKRNFNPSSESISAPTNSLQAVTRSYSPDIGMVLAEVPGLSPSYTFKGDELYVRAKIISSRKRQLPHPTNENEVAWIQPVAPRKQ